VSLLLYDPSEGIASFLGLVCSVSSLTWFFWCFLYPMSPWFNLISL
jgi:hypothetical protein